MTADREWKPGDVAMIYDRVAVRAEADCTACKDIRGKTPGDHWHDSKMRLGYGFDHEARPLVVIDPEDEETVDRVANAITNSHTHVGVRTGLDWLNTQAALRSLLEPPKPPEPTGIGAVVEDAEAHRWTKARDSVACWCSSHGLWREWDRVPAVRVLSDGVQP